MFAFDWKKGPLAVSAPSSRSVTRRASVNTPGDHWERKANAVAAAVMRKAIPPTAGLAGTVMATTRAAGPRGAALPPGLRAEFESRFNHDFSRVRIHADSEAAAAASALRARAYTSGNHVVFGAGAYHPAAADGQRLLAHELAHVQQQAGAVGRGGDAAPPIIQRQTDFGAMYRDRGGTVRSRSQVEYEQYKAGLGATKASSAAGGRRLDLSQPLKVDELLEVYKGVAADVAKMPDLQATIEYYVAKLNQAFRAFQIDTIEAQASYIANAFHESDQLRYMTETEKAVRSNKPYQSELSQIQLNTTWLNQAAAGKIKDVAGYETGGTINPKGDWQHSFIGRGPIQVTHQHGYVESLAMMEKRQEELEAADPGSQDAKDLREAIDAIKIDPAQAANPKYAFMFSAAFMKKPHGGGKGGDVKATEGQVTNWMGPQPPDAEKTKRRAYDLAVKMLERKRAAQYGYGVEGDPLTTGGFGADDATIRVRPGPVRTTLIQAR